MEIIFAVLVLGLLGMLFGIGLAIASKRFCVETNPNLERIISCLPGANCGACGLPGCMAFAQSLAKGEVSPDLCRATEEEARNKLAGILGIKLGIKVKQVAVLHCGGGKRVKNRFQYNGIKDCQAANLLQRGQKSCSYGCLGFDTCVDVCPFDAISMSRECLPVVDIHKCRACGKCVEACPKHLFSLIPLTSRVVVNCSSCDLGRDTRAVCQAGCIACGRCEKACPADAIKVINPVLQQAQDASKDAEQSRSKRSRGIDNLAVIDYSKCTSCGECIKVCPTKCIIDRGEDS